MRTATGAIVDPVHEWSQMLALKREFSRNNAEKKNPRATSMHYPRRGVFLPNCREFHPEAAGRGSGRTGSRGHAEG